MKMALEYDLSTDADLDDDELREFFAAAIEGEIGAGGTVFRDGMYATVYRVADGEEDETSRLFGFNERVSGTFRFQNLASERDREHNVALMISSALAFSARYASRGVLLHNGDVAILQWSPGEVVFHSGWHDWLDGVEVAALVAGHPVRPLPQPLL
ncbi:SitI3 family protein [Actinoplanes sp. NPDC023936]|uniref:SitI3 family protein n=1 Tax=Actinoplanes sp. NPDC023936 TaxID=3154910 RepID=UPI0033FEDD58